MSEYIIEIPDYVPPFDPAARTASLGEEIVRCRDCKHYKGVICLNGFIDGEPDAFCSWGERRDA